MKYILMKRGEPVAECVDIGGTLHVHWYNQRGAYQYSFGQWPKGKYVPVKQ